MSEVRRMWIQIPVPVNISFVTALKCERCMCYNCLVFISGNVSQNGIKMVLEKKNSTAFHRDSNTDSSYPLFKALPLEPRLKNLAD